MTDSDSPALPTSPDAVSTRPAWLPRGVVGAIVVALAIGGFGVGQVTEGLGSGREKLIDEEAPLPIPGASDAFASESTGLGLADSGQRWLANRGKWDVTAEGARVSTPADGVSLALLGVGTASGRFEVTAAKIAPGFGLAFHCRNAANCWRVEAVPDLGTWNIIKVVKGLEVLHGNIGTAPVADGTRLAVVTEADRVTVFVDDVEYTTVRDGELSDQLNAGLSLREPASAPVARWRDFRVETRVHQGVVPSDEAEIRDDFARADADEIGTLTTGQTWQVRNGKFGIRNGRAALLRRPDGDTVEPSLALIDAPSSDGIVQITMLPEQTGAGVAFRCRDEKNCIYLTAVPGFGTWNLSKRVNGVETKLDDTNLTAADPGIALSIELNGPEITISVNGVRTVAVTETEFVNETGIGLITVDGPFVTDARWFEFVYASLGESR